MFKASQFKLICFSFVSFPAPYLNPIFTIKAPALSAITGCRVVAVVAAAAAFLWWAARKPTHVRREFVSAFERDSQFLAYFSGSPSFVLFVVEAFIQVILACIRSILLAVFAFGFTHRSVDLLHPHDWLRCLVLLLLLSLLCPRLLLLSFFFFLLAFFVLLPESLSTENVLSL